MHLYKIPKLLVAFCCVLNKDTLQHFPLLDGLGKQFKFQFKFQFKQFKYLLLN